MPLFFLLIIFVSGVFVIFGFYPGHGRTGVVEFREIILLLSFSYAVVGLLIFVLGFFAIGFQGLVSFLVDFFSRNDINLTINPTQSKLPGILVGTTHRCYW